MENIINQLFEIEKKATAQDLALFDRNLRRIFHELEAMGYKIVNPLGQRYDERDASIEASMVGPGASKITKVLKPVIYQDSVDGLKLIQKGVVIAE